MAFAEQTDMALSVTVGIPTPNNAETIRETLAQLLMGNRVPDRIQIVDASTDETPETIERVASETAVDIRCADQQETGRGVGAARQQIYHQFEGDILACLDTNIRVDETWLQRRVQFHARHPEYDVLSATPLADADGEVRDPKRGYYFNQNNCSITRGALDRVNGWDPWFQRGEDWEMGIRLWRSGARMYAMHELDGEPMTPDSLSEDVRKAANRPSSVAFLRKYGLWYLTFHPTHVLGDVASVALVLAPVLAAVSPALTLGSVLVSVLLTTAFLYFYFVPHRNGSLLRLSDVRKIPHCYLFGYTAFRELRAGDFPWNCGGLDHDDCGRTDELKTDSE